MVDYSYVLTCEALAQSLGLSKPATPVIQEVQAEGGEEWNLKVQALLSYMASSKPNCSYRWACFKELN